MSDNPRVRKLRLICLPVMMVVASFMLAGCPSAPSTSDKDLQRVEIRELTEWISESTERKPTLVVDLRSPERYAAGHIPGAINIPQAELNSYDSRFARMERIVFYHESISGLYADMATKKLMGDGIGNVYSFGGGWEAWEKQAD